MLIQSAVQSKQMSRWLTSSHLLQALVVISCILQRLPMLCFNSCQIKQLTSSIPPQALPVIYLGGLEINIFD